MAGPSRRISAGIGAFAVTLAGASFAWACSSQPTVNFSGGSGPASAPAGTVVDVSGRDWDARPVEITWNSPAGARIELKPAKGPSFSVPVKIPETARPGSYVIYFMQAEQDPTSSSEQKLNAVARLPFEVTLARPGDASYQPDAGTSPNSRTSGSTIAGESEGGPTSASTAGGDQSSSSGSGPAGESFGSLAPGRPAASAAPASDQGTSQQRPVVTPGSVSAVPTAKVPASGASAQPVFGSASAGVPGPGATVDATSEGEAGGPSVRSASSDLWGGFESGNPSLLPGAGDTTPSSSGSGPGLAVGAGLLSAGLGALVAGFGAAEARRKRQPVQQRS